MGHADERMEIETVGRFSIRVAKETTFLDEVASKSGRPDYVGWLNKRMGPTPHPDKNIVVLLLPTLPEIEQRPLHKVLRVNPTDLRTDFHLPVMRFDSPVGKQAEKCRLQPWKTGTAPELETWLQQSKPVRQAVRRCLNDGGVFYCPLVLTRLEYNHSGYEGTCLNLVQSNLAWKVLQVADAAVIEGMRHLSRNDAAAALEEFESLVMIARAMTSEVWSRYTGLSMQRKASTFAMSLLLHGELSQEQARRLSDQLAAIAQMRDVSSELNAYFRCWMLDSVCRSATDGPNAMAVCVEAGEKSHRALREAFMYRLSFQVCSWNHVLETSNQLIEEMIRLAKSTDRREREHQHGELWDRVSFTSMRMSFGRYSLLDEANLLFQSPHKIFFANGPPSLQVQSLLFESLGIAARMRRRLTLALYGTLGSEALNSARWALSDINAADCLMNPILLQARLIADGRPINARQLTEAQTAPEIAVRGDLMIQTDELEDGDIVWCLPPGGKTARLSGQTLRDLKTNGCLPIAGDGAAIWLPRIAGR